MTREFLNKIRRLGVYDTRKYRYVTRVCGEYLHVERIRINALDTVAAMDPWEVVAVYVGR